MILFVSGRCDIPAFFSTWFYNRLKEGYVDVRNPFDSHAISRIYLNEQNIDVILFCTKNPIPMLSRLDEIAFPYLFHITFTPYHHDIEPMVINKKKILEAIRQLSDKLGKERVIVRYDPILLTDKYTIAYHERAFHKLCEELYGYVDKIIISFVDLYKNTKEHKNEVGLTEITEQDMHAIAKYFGSIAKKYHMNISTCAEEIDLQAYGIQKGKCIDRIALEKVAQHSLAHIKDKGVRQQCSCIQTVDIGDYNCCVHGCKYCYANYQTSLIQENMQMHDPNSSVLIGHIQETDRIVIREEKRIQQLSLL